MRGNDGDGQEQGQGSNVLTMQGQTGAFQAVRQPPPEKPDAVRLRTLVILSFWGVILLLGLPMWWKTTSIYRAKLPFEEMQEWDQGTACQPNFPIEIAIVARSIPYDDAKHFVQTAQHALDDLNEFPPHHLRLRLIKLSAPEATTDNNVGASCSWITDGRRAKQFALCITLEPQEGQASALNLQVYSMNAVLKYAPNQLPSPSSSTSQVTTYLASELHALFLDEQASIAYKVASQNSVNIAGPVTTTRPSTRNNGNPSGFVKGLPKALFERLSSRQTRSFRYAETYHVTFSLFTAGPFPSSWDISGALETYIQPWVDAMSAISHFTINSQVQLYSAFAPSVHPVLDPATNGTSISKANLSAFVNAAEWPLSPTIGSSGPTVNFVLYVPSAQQVPLTIADTDGGTEWLIPQWGGVAIYNPSIVPNNGTTTTPEYLDSEVLSGPFTTFRTQLLSLLGVPGTSKTPLPLRLQSLVRLQTMSLFLSASSTLGSLARLTKSLPSIPIPRSVSRNVESTITHLTKSCEALKSGLFNVALQEVREAEKEAELAFFEKSMVGQVYFPDEHKVAVYLPLLGPVSFPLILGLVKEIRRFVQARRQKSPS